MILATSSAKKFPLRDWKNQRERCDRSLPGLGSLLLPRRSRSQPQIVRGIFFVEWRAMSRSASLGGTIDDNHRRYATRVYAHIYTRIYIYIYTYMHLHAFNNIHNHTDTFRQTDSIHTTAVAYITRRDTCECECTQVVRCYRAAASWCFYPLDTRYTHTRTHTHTHTHTQRERDT